MRAYEIIRTEVTEKLLHYEASASRDRSFDDLLTRLVRHLLNSLNTD
jgi:hypothetical protein